jgi:uncharacterized membrane protein
MKFGSLLNWLKNLDSVPRRFVSFGLAGLIFLVLPSSVNWKNRLLATWSAGVVCFLALILLMMIYSTPERTRARAQRRQANPRTMFGLVIFTAFASLFAIGLMLASGKDKFEQLALAVVAIISSWLLTHTSFALNYARYYYDDDNISNQERGYAGGLEFPTEEPPDYLDFMYFAFTISMTSQTSDVSITSRPLRRLVLAHEMVSFFFYSVIIGFVVNSIGNLI